MYEDGTRQPQMVFLFFYFLVYFFPLCPGFFRYRLIFVFRLLPACMYVRRYVETSHVSYPTVTLESRHRQSANFIYIYIYIFLALRCRLGGSDFSLSCLGATTKRTPQSLPTHTKSYLYNTTVAQSFPHCPIPWVIYICITRCKWAQIRAGPPSYRM